MVDENSPRGDGVTIDPPPLKRQEIAIPAKTPHQWKDTSKSGSVCYYAVNYQT
jgi:hypothetical protein